MIFLSLVMLGSKSSSLFSSSVAMKPPTGTKFPHLYFAEFRGAEQALDKLTGVADS
jgi:hypothetical protein